MTEEQRKQKTCTNKERFGTKKGAKFFARARGLRFYHCPYCSGFHLTSKNISIKHQETLKKVRL